MLQIKDIHKEYKTGPLVQRALDGVSLNLRDNEFVAILGPSGSGKTTLLNVIGGLDRYDSGDLVINGISTKKYKDRDWDSYRNHTIGFVFQSYNLIPHQTVLANVELALTISGIGKQERKKRAAEALARVGLGDQLHKKPSQMSGGQMQRVAIARALVNDPDIVLADEPTGALDSSTSIQVMELLKEVAKDRLVVMVTHNPELAQDYASRIVTLKDGKILSDTNPYEPKAETIALSQHKNMGRSSMSFLTALSLSFHNLRTKKARTILTSFAGSIGIIGIALILAISNGVNAYIKSLEEETLSEYPLQITSTGFDISSMLVAGSGGNDKAAGEDGTVHVMEIVTNFFHSMESNDLKSLKTYLDSKESGMEPYTNALEYSYSVEPQIYKEEDDGSVRQVNPDHSFDKMGIGSSASASSMMSSMMSTNVFYQMPANSRLYENQYEVKAGRWPEAETECVLVLSNSGGVSDFVLYTMGLRDPLELDEMVDQFLKEEDVKAPEKPETYSYEDFLGVDFKLVRSTDYYQYDSQYDLWRDKSGDPDYMKKLVTAGETLTVVGVVQPAKGAAASALTPGIKYPASLVTHVAELTGDTQIVQDQLADKTTDVFTGSTFGKTQENSFDMESLFTVDADAIKNAIRFDESVMTGGLSGGMDVSDAFSMDPSVLDFGSMDLSGISIDLPQTGMNLDLSELLSGLEPSVSEDGLKSMASSLLEGYNAYAKTHPEADYSGLMDQFLNYLGSEEARTILSDHIKKIISDAGGIRIPTDALQQMMEELLTDFRRFADEKGYTDPEKFQEYLLEYLQTDEARTILKKWADQIFQISGDITISADQIKALASDLITGYSAYAKKNGFADPADMGNQFAAYLKTADGQKRLMEGISGTVDLNGLQSQIGSAVERSMASVMESYTGALSRAVETQISSAMSQLVTRLSNGIAQTMQTAMTQMGRQLQEALGTAMTVDTEAFASAFQVNLDQNDLKELLMSMASSGSASYEGNLQKLGYVDFAEPATISIYPKDFKSKEQVIAILDAYNDRMEAEGKEEQVISYTDVVGTLMSSVTDIVDIVSYVLIAFVAISLIVSSIMIGVITYISVLERRKEIGILRAIGASKRNVSQVFNAETFIIGLLAGLIGIGVTLLVLIPGNILLHHLTGTSEVSASLPALPALILILLSIGLTLLGGLIPSKKAAKSDPVTALRVD